MPGFSEDSAKRIARSVRYTERLQGVPSTDPNENYGAASGNQICLVQTGPTLPTGYTGAMGAPGQVIEKQANGTINKLGAIWIKDINGGTLSASTIYQARIGGTWKQDVTTNGIVKPTTLGLYLVQAASTGSGLTIGSSISGRIQVDYNAPNNSNRPVLMSATLPDGSMQSFTLLNVGPDWRFGQSTLAVYGMAIVSNPATRTAQLSVVFPFFIYGECQKDYLGNYWWIANYGYKIPIGDPLNLSIKYGSYFYGIMIVPCSYTSPPFPWLTMTTQYGWSTNQFEHPWKSLLNTGGIGSGIGSGISGV
jgi:hypothetical protein